MVYPSKHLPLDDMLLQFLSDVLCINNGIGIWRIIFFFNGVVEEYDDDDDEPFLKREEYGLLL